MNRSCRAERVTPSIVKKRVVTLLCMFSLVALLKLEVQPGFAQVSDAQAIREEKKVDEVTLLKEQIRLQQSQIQELQSRFDWISQRLEPKQRSESDSSTDPPNLGQTASLKPMAPSAPVGGGSATAAQSSASLDDLKQSVVKVDEVNKKVDDTLKNLGGFKFSGDFRFRLDAQVRSGNSIAPPLQNIRSRYRLRFNVDKEIDPRFKFHTQLSTGPLNNGITNDQDFAGTIVKHPLSIAEAYIDFHPNKNISIRGGRMEEIFADNMRFLWDDDVRFNGFQQIVRLPFDSNHSVELRAGEYFLSNPNVAILSPTSPFVSAGYQPGQKVRTANLFHPGVVLNLSAGGKWKHQFTTDVQLYRNPNQIQLASLATGFPVLVSNAIGLALSGPTTGLGNATTIPGGAIYTAPDFQIARTSYRVEYTGIKVGEREMPFWLNFQASRNYGTGKLNDAFISSANLGAIKKTGDLRFLYQFAIKDANALISQFTDDDLGTGSGVNIAVHALRFDVGLTRFLQWQNLFFIQHQRRASNPDELFFVPLQRGANSTFRYLGQLAFNF